ncbi:MULTISPECIES: DUF378 domain-containing protein [unclassified Virgibacillus]|uniref:DUF378 domain-containing protein n=1 Tax=unclassified Virgibacillus TaxID=2620237 RepID=UPI0024DEA0FE|nr:DUF378 domain-containing protein [Virgibacillus sp. LDC-1]
MQTLQRIALALVIIGAINWGLIGFFNFDLVAAIFGGQTAALSRVIYALVGLSGLVCISLLFAPLGEEDDVTDRTVNTGNLQYGTEFGEDPDFSNTDKPNRD